MHCFEMRTGSEDPIAFERCEAIRHSRERQSSMDGGWRKQASFRTSFQVNQT